MIRVGILGMSEGNGHPFSFAAIINGYDDEAFAASGWPVIHRYLGAQPPGAVGLPGIRVDCAWTQDAAVTRRLCDACRIERPLASPDEMPGRVDAAIIARDDWQSHAPLARPFLERGIPVFVDKPLTLDPEELAYFAPHLEAGALFTSAGLRYAAEIEPLRRGTLDLGEIRLIEAVVLNDLARYGIHMLEAAASLGLGLPTRVTRLDAPHESLAISFDNGTPMVLSCLGAVAKVFHLSVFGSAGHAHFDLHDNFSAFRSMLLAFFEMVRSGRPAIDPSETIRLLRTIMAGRTLAAGMSTELG